MGMPLYCQFQRGFDADNDPIRITLTQVVDRGGGRRVAGDDQRLAALRKKPLCALQGQTADFLRAPRPVGRVGGVSELDRVFLRNPATRLPQNAESTQAGIEYRDRQVFHVPFGTSFVMAALAAGMRKPAGP